MKIVTEELIRKRCSVEESTEAYLEYHLPFIRQFVMISKVTNVLEVGCGEGGGLVPFAEKGCDVTGIEDNPMIIRQAKEYFKQHEIRAKVFPINEFMQKDSSRLFDLIIVNNTIERITDKQYLFNKLVSVLSPNGVIFFSFHPWNMPFSGCRYYCRSRIPAFIPYLHLLPEKVYGFVLSKIFREDDMTVKKLLRIKKCAPRLKEFREMVSDCKCSVRGEKYYFIDPLYQVKYKYWINKFLSKRIDAKIPLGDLFKVRCSYIIARDNYHIRMI